MFSETTENRRACQQWNVTQLLPGSGIAACTFYCSPGARRMLNLAEVFESATLASRLHRGMQVKDVTTITVIFLIITMVAVAAALCMYLLWYRTRTLRDHFGPEYDRTVEQEHGHAWRAETVLQQRQERVRKLHIRPLSSDERDRLAAEWHTAQERFVDNPGGALAAADTVINHVLDGSVDEIHVVCGFRLGHYLPHQYIQSARL